jgi:hypothetical protein
VERQRAPEGIGSQLVHVVRHLASRHRPTVDALRLIAEGTLPAYRLPGRAGWWVEADRLEAGLSAHGPRLQAEADRRRAGFRL